MGSRGRGGLYLEQGDRELLSLSPSILLAVGTVIECLPRLLAWSLLFLTLARQRSLNCWSQSIIRPDQHTFAHGKVLLGQLLE